MEALLNKISSSNLDASSVSGNDAIIFWEHIRKYIAATPKEKAHCLVISAEFRYQLKQFQTSIDELKEALNYLSLPQDAELILDVKSGLAERLLSHGDYKGALDEYASASIIALHNGFIDAYARSILGMGQLCSIYGDNKHALKYFKKVDQIDHAISSRSLRLSYKLSMLEAYINTEKTQESEALLKECEELSILVSDKVLAGQVQLCQAILHRKNQQIELALHCLGDIHFVANNIHSKWLLNMIRLELAQCLDAINKSHLAIWLLESAQQRAKSFASPEINLKFFIVLSDISENNHDFKNALNYQRQAYQIESELLRTIPIGELGSSQFRRLSRFDLQLKLILSEQENRELKETTENQKDTVAKLKQDAHTDPLTSLHNRRWLDIKFKELIMQNIPFALIVVDIDHFKSINDELTHLVGDKAIVQVSKILSEYFSFGTTSCVRFGGEEFLVILEKADIHQAKMHAEKYREAIFQYDWQQILGERALTVSIGITLHREGENTQRTFHRADKALYRAKASGRNQVCVE